MTTTASIISGENEVLILGDQESLEALGHALLLKAKLGDNFRCTITDGINKPIRIFLREEIGGEE